jgi:hypothetical protein
VIAPFLDDAVVEFLSALPATMFLDHGFHTEAIAGAYPKHAHLPFENKASAPVVDGAHFRKYSRDVLRFALATPNGGVVNRRALLSRCLRVLLDGGYSRNVAGFGTLAVLLLQLERVMSRA